MALKRVIVALGGSEYMEAAVAEACQIAARNGAEIVGIAVLDETLVDPAEPLVVRERAFSLISCAVSGPLRTCHALAA